jgi:autotransporter-associated beta strand protein
MPDGKRSKPLPCQHRLRPLATKAWAALWLLWLCAGLSTGFAVNVLLDPGFEEGGGAWSMMPPTWVGTSQLDTNLAHTGVNSWRFNATNADGSLTAADAWNGGRQLNIPVSDTKFYQYSAWVNVPTANSTANKFGWTFRHNIGAGGLDLGYNLVTAPGWTLVAGPILQPAPGVTMWGYYGFHSVNFGGQLPFYVDDCAVSELDAWALNGRVVDGATNGVDGVLVTATSPLWTTTATTAGGGYYTATVPGAATTYTLAAKTLGYLGGTNVAVSATPTTAADIILVTDPDYVPNLLVNLRASTLPLGADLASWPNVGILGGSFDKFAGGTGPEVTTVTGKKAVNFVQTDSAVNRRTLASATPAPTSLSGNNPWTISTVLYRSSTQPGGENAYAQWAGGSYADAQSAIFNYTDNRAYMHWGTGYDLGFQTVPSANAWHAVTITYDATNEIVYVDGVVNRTTDRTATPLSINPGGLMIVGSRTWHDARGEDQYWRFNGAIASLKIFDRALSAAEVAALVTVPKYTITVTAGTGGTVSPGTGPVDEGDSPIYAITPSLGYAVAGVLVDGASVGAVTSYQFTNVTATHTIDASFVALPSQLVSGKVTDGATGILGATVYFSLSAPANANPLFTTTTTNAAGGYSISLPPANWHVVAGAVGYDYSADATFTVASAPVSVTDVVLTANPNWDVLFSLTVDSLTNLAAGDPTGNRATAYPVGGMLNMIATPTVAAVDGVNWESNDRDDSAGNDGYELAGVSFLGGVVASGASIVVVAQPRYAAVGGEARGEIVSLYYNGFNLCVDHATGEIIIARKSWTFERTGVFIPDGQKSILCVVAQLDGSCKLYVNGSEEWSGAALGANYFARLEGTDMGWMTRIGVGRNPWDGWSSYNGNIGDVYVYKTAIPDAKRKTLQTALAAKFGISLAVATYNWAGTNNGNWSSLANWNNTVPGTGNTATFSDSATAGATVQLDSAVEVKGIVFNNLVANQAIASTAGNTLTLNNGVALPTISTEAGTHTISTALDSAVGLNKTGAGKLTLSGTVNLASLSTVNPVLIVSGPGSELALAGPTTVGSGKSTRVTANGKLTISGELATGSADQVIGEAGTPGTLELSGTGSWTHSGSGYFQVGNDGIAGLGTVTVNGTAVLDLSTAANGTLNIAVGWGTGSAGAVVQNGGTVRTTPIAEAWRTGKGPGVGLGNWGPSTTPCQGAYTLNGGVLITPSIGSLAWAGDYVTGGVVNPATYNSTAVVKLNGGTLRASASDLADPNAIEEGTAHLIFNTTHTWVQAGGALIDTDGNNNSIGVALEHDATGPAIDGGLTKLGLGTLTLTRASTYTGPTKVQAGTLACTNATALGAGDLEIAAAATLDLGYVGTRTVASLKIAGSYKGPGVYGSTTAGITGTGTVTVPAPGLPLSGFTRPGGVPTFAIPNTAVGSTYRLVYKNSLSDPTWTPIGAGTAGNNGTLSLSDTSTPPLPANRFYRLQVQ